MSHTKSLPSCPTLNIPTNIRIREEYNPYNTIGEVNRINTEEVKKVMAKMKVRKADAGATVPLISRLAYSTDSCKRRGHSRNGNATV